MHRLAVLAVLGAGCYQTVVMDGGPTDCLGAGQTDGVCNPVLVARDEANPTGVAAFMGSATQVWWIDATTSGALRHCDLAAGGSCPASTAVTTTSPHALVHDASTLYWIDEHHAGADTVLSFAADCTTCRSATTVAMTPTAGGDGSLAVGSNDLFWTDDSQTGHVYASSVQVLTPVTLGSASDYTTAITVDATIGLVYYVDGLAIMSCPEKAAPCTPAMVVNVVGTAVPNPPTALATFEQRLYWTSINDNAVASCDPTACAATLAVVASDQPSPTALAVDSSGVYWTNRATTAPECDTGSGSVAACSLDTCTAPHVLATAQACPSAIDLLDAAVVWSNAGSGAGAAGSIMAIAKP